MAKMSTLAAVLLERKSTQEKELIALPGAVGIGRGTLTEIAGGRSSGRTALIHALLAASTSQQETCAVVDCAGSFDPSSAAANGVALGRLLWVRCDNRPDQAMRAADWILHAGGFGAVVLDLCDIAPEILRRIPLTWWYRFRRAIENTPTILMITANQPMTGSCAAHVLGVERGRPVWSGSVHVPLLAGIEMKIVPRKPAAAGIGLVEARWAG